MLEINIKKLKLINNIFSLMKEDNLNFIIKYNLLGFGSILRLYKKEDKLYFFTAQGVTVCSNLNDITPDILEFIFEKLKTGNQDTLILKSEKNDNLVQENNKNSNLNKIKPIQIKINEKCEWINCMNQSFSINHKNQTLCQKHFLNRMQKYFLKQHQNLISIENKNEYLGQIYSHRNGKKYLTIESFYAIFENKNLNGLVLYLKHLGYVYNVNPNRIIKNNKGENE